MDGLALALALALAHHFAFDFQPLGGVHLRLALQLENTEGTLWPTNRPTGRERVRIAFDFRLFPSGEPKIREIKNQCSTKLIIITRLVHAPSPPDFARTPNE